MKALLSLSIITLFVCSCQKDVEDVPTSNETIENLPSIQEDNRVLILKVDYLTFSFEGGNELLFDDTSSFNISSNYNPPGDFGDIQLYYEEFDELIFDGTIIWMGTGNRSYPETMNPAINFEIINEN